MTENYAYAVDSTKVLARTVKMLSASVEGLLNTNPLSAITSEKVSTNMRDMLAAEFLTDEQAQGLLEPLVSEITTRVVNYVAAQREELSSDVNNQFVQRDIKPLLMEVGRALIFADALSAADTATAKLGLFNLSQPFVTKFLKQELQTSRASKISICKCTFGTTDQQQATLAAIHNATELTLSGLQLYLLGWPALLTQLSNQNPNLTHLDLTENFFNEADQLLLCQRLVTLFPNLESLKLDTPRRGLSEPLSGALTHLANQHPSLQQLECVYLTQDRQTQLSNDIRPNKPDFALTMTRTLNSETQQSRARNNAKRRLEFDRPYEPSKRTRIRFHAEPQSRTSLAVAPVSNPDSDNNQFVPSR